MMNKRFVWSLTEVSCPCGSMTAQGQEIVPTSSIMGNVCLCVCLCVYIYMLSVKDIVVDAVVKRDIWDVRGW